jgi:isoquinoline 1-oxidoreductase subunit beta
MSADTLVPLQSTRRSFLKVAGATAATALTIGFDWSASTRRAVAAAPSPPSAAGFMPNAFLKIDSGNRVTVIAKHVEMGQGAYTGIATVVAEELDADWAQVRVESAPADAKRYANLAFGTMQGTGGSSAMANSWNQLREAGAKARAMLLAAAAKEWHVPVAELTVERGIVRHSRENRQATFGALVATAATLPVPAQVTLKLPKDFKLIGQRLPRVDAEAKSNGTAQFTLDVAFPGMRVALLKRPPLFGATVKSFDPAPAMAVPGVVKVVQVPRGVAVIAGSFWAAKQGRDALTVEWDQSKAEKRSSAAIMDEYRRLAQRPAVSARKEGDAARAIADAVRKVSAGYEFPYLAHAPMEPLDAVVKLSGDSCEIWAGDQFQTVDQANAAHTAGLDPQQVSIHTLYAGGSFGRRANPGSDYIVEAVSIAKACGADGTPIKLQWTREDDIHGGLYRPMYFHKLEAGLNAEGRLIGWRHVVVGQSIVAGTPFGAMIKAGIDPTSVEGAANVAYDIPNVTVELSTAETGVPVLWWRVVGSSHTTFAVEAFIDEVAHAAGEDGFTFRRKLLGHHPRMKAVLELAAEKAGWADGPLPKGRGRGIAVAEAFNTYVAQVAEVSVDEDGQVKVDRVVCAVDCGTPINPDIIAAQMEGGIGFGLGAVLYGAITLKEGRVEQDNFNGYRVLRMNEMPRVEVHIVPSTEAPTGVGEPGVAPVGPAVANAIFAATGKRIHVLPFSKDAQRRG